VVNHDGVPDKNSSAIIVEASASLVAAIAWIEVGRAEKSRALASALDKSH